MKLDILVFAAHPDDAELSCSGTILAEVAKGKKVGIVDLTRGEMGTRGTPELRQKEADKAAKILGLSVRENLGFKDVFFQNDKAHQLELVRVIRKYQPEIVIGNAIHDRHIDHGKGAQLCTDACFIAGLAKVETIDEGIKQGAWRPKVVYHYIQSRYIKPDVVVDITPYWENKMEAIRAFSSQFYDPNSKEPDTYISSPQFMQFIEARAKEMGQAIEVKYGEGFTVERVPGANALSSLK
ncbi:bacillithiol biosynthesis deacetylase BshB1 [Cytophagales bacterium LB-30]|uniref:Bacillithiol biosynthesis deacetylase BshB1 n=1 Tax=Shiella aurantiaca TaxID=3058365 RepID=A0ABT8F600_9BACT|nr:bacillithiol biosynthesis deacetylase BshB1 [Shiella aurantiaca]MDN4165396.1 bacillithiol biosynthesis deacetylase BshB1 [Shiella aurantiaca]